MTTKNYDKNKLFYSIGEVAEIFDINTSLIRFWEKEFKQISPEKSKTGKRKFTKKDIETFKTIYELVKKKGFTLQGAKDSLKNDKNSLLKKQKIRTKLESIKQKLEELKR